MREAGEGEELASLSIVRTYFYFGVCVSHLSFFISNVLLINQQLALCFDCFDDFADIFF